MVVAMGLLLLGGCADQPDSQASVESLSLVAAEDADPSIASPPGQPVLVVLAVVNESYTNPVPPPDPSKGGQEWTVWEAELPAGYLNLTFAFSRSHLSADVFVPHCRVYHGDALAGQGAFSDSAIGQVVSDGTCTVSVTDILPGTWSAVYSADAIQPGGTHEVGLRVTAWSMEDSG
jgi:hypothetical protein